MNPTISKHTTQHYSVYYQAQAQKKTLWFVMGCVRNQENWAFARTYNMKKNIIEFFVAPAYEQDFIQLLQMLKNQGYILSFEKKPNRLAKEDNL
jgi:hypothetical protein